MWSFYIDLTFTPLQGAVCWLMASDFENALFDIEDRVNDQKVEEMKNQAASMLTASARWSGSYFKTKTKLLCIIF